MLSKLRMELAAEVDLGLAGGGRGEFLDPLLCQRAIEGVPRTGVGRRHDVGGAALAGGVEHGDTFGESAGAIIDSPEDVAVDIDHAWRDRYANMPRGSARKFRWWADKEIGTPQGYRAGEEGVHMPGIRWAGIFTIWCGLSICGGRAYAQPSDGGSGDRAATSSYASTVVRENPGSIAAPRRDSWWWVHAGVAVQLAGTFSDWATSWKQPEGNQWLAQSGGDYAGRFYRTGTAKKFALAAGLSLVSYGLAWKWPKMRRFVGIFNLTMGGGMAAAAVKNVAQNPYYKP